MGNDDNRLKKQAKDKFKVMFGMDVPEDATVTIRVEKKSENLWKKLKKK